ncbi:hypothetical protein EDM54_13300 [Brevibacillus borstelensis]|nr:hypothetical protein EDM54_13300 [Brevibacillus borstelensis]
MDVFPPLLVSFMLTVLLYRLNKYRLTRYNRENIGIALCSLLISSYIKTKLVFVTITVIFAILLASFIWGLAKEL